MAFERLKTVAVIGALALASLTAKSCYEEKLEEELESTLQTRSQSPQWHFGNLSHSLERFMSDLSTTAVRGGLATAEGSIYNPASVQINLLRHYYSCDYYGGGFFKGTNVFIESSGSERQIELDFIDSHGLNDFINYNGNGYTLFITEDDLLCGQYYGGGYHCNIENEENRGEGYFGITLSTDDQNHILEARLSHYVVLPESRAFIPLDFGLEDQRIDDGEILERLQAIIDNYQTLPQRRKELIRSEQLRESRRQERERILNTYRERSAAEMRARPQATEEQLDLFIEALNRRRGEEWTWHNDREWREEDWLTAGDISSLAGNFFNLANSLSYDPEDFANILRRTTRNLQWRYYDSMNCRGSAPEGIVNLFGCNSLEREETLFHEIIHQLFMHGRSTSVDAWQGCYVEGSTEIMTRSNIPDSTVRDSYAESILITAALGYDFYSQNVTNPREFSRMINWEYRNRGLRENRRLFRYVEQFAQQWGIDVEAEEETLRRIFIETYCDNPSLVPEGRGSSGTELRTLLLRNDIELLEFLATIAPPRGNFLELWTENRIQNH